jgi:hypothetical protein
MKVVFGGSGAEKPHRAEAGGGCPDAAEEMLAANG